MFRAMAALAVVGVLGVLGAGRAAMTDAQEARTRKIVLPSGDGKVVVELDEWEEVQQRGPEFVPPQPGRGRNQPGPGMPGGWPGDMAMGGWTVHDTRQGAILLNQMSGESFILREGKDGMQWQPIHRPGMDKRNAPGPQPRAERPPQQPDRPNFEEARKRIEKEIEEARANMQRKLDDLRGKLKETKNKDERRKISDMIDELEANLERLAEKKEAALKRLREQHKNAPDKDRDEEGEEWESED